MNHAGRCVVTVVGCALALAAAPCFAAGRATNQLAVSVSPTNSCTVAAAPLIFLVPVPINGNVDSTSTITVRCPPNTPYVIEIDNGLYPQGNNRRVKHLTSNAFLTYDVYKDPPRSQVWGKGNLKQVNGNSGLLGLVVYPVFGRLDATRSMSAGGYNDSLTVTVTF